MRPVVTTVDPMDLSLFFLFDYLLVLSSHWLVAGVVCLDRCFVFGLGRQGGHPCRHLVFGADSYCRIIRCWGFGIKRL